MAIAGTVRAALPRRLVAALVDLALTGAVGAGALFAGGEPIPRGIVAVAALAVGQWLVQGLRGWTVGKRLMGLRVLDPGTGRPVGAARMLGRFLVLGAGSVLTALTVLRRDRRGWHDLAAGTAVYDVVRGVDPSAAPAVSASSAGRRLEALLEAPRTPPEAAPRPPEAAMSPLETPTSPWEAVMSPLEVPMSPQLEPDEVMARPAVPAGPAEPAGPALPLAPDGGLDPELEETRMSSIRRREVPEGGPGVRIELWDGRVVAVTGNLLVGRNPAARAGEPAPLAVLAVEDPGRSVSKTHLLLGTDPHGLWLQDRDSTNGTVVTLADGQQILCAADQTVRVPGGANVAFGDYWLTVL